ncbi:50S ribosomal protein L18 [Trichlorobacter ammonificans]|uniref:Large ribosomal subunit protein uL18 n=1 Tax=Trichlorobacter ammonificans TaxID=2916410 RepID=A0ABN8HCZ7_9BACT|nr:50S ribosomal protein L18 [Trichlorobacter ammonificans]CAH2030595.1 50S ribosomal subunit protein L18 [Trichlorobacter ammonificans]
MGKTAQKTLIRRKRQVRVRKKVLGTPERPRLSVFRSANHIYAQLIDDSRGVTLAAASSLTEGVAQVGVHTGNKASAALVGKAIASVALAKGIQSVVFDRNGFLYHGRIQTLADAAREAGLKF